MTKQIVQNLVDPDPALAVHQLPGQFARGNPALAVYQADSTGPAILVHGAGQMIDMQTPAGASKFSVDGAGNVTAAGAAVTQNLENFTHPVTALAATMPRNRATTAQAANTSGTLYVTGLGIPAGVTTSAATFWTNTTAKTGGTHGWYVLLDAARKVLAVTADQTDAATVWGATNTGYPLNFASPVAITTTGLYYIGVMVAQSAGQMPTFSGANSIAAGVSSGTGVGSAIVLGASSSAAQTVPPNVGDTMGAFTGLGTALFYAYLT